MNILNVHKLVSVRWLHMILASIFFSGISLQRVANTRRRSQRYMYKAPGYNAISNAIETFKNI